MAIWALLFNKNSGSAATEQHNHIEQLFKTAGQQARAYYCDEGNSLEELVQQAIANGADTIVAGGGDGTISAIAGALIKHPDVVMGVLPLGTFNNFAKTLGIPLQIDEAVKVLLARNVRKIDLGQVNEKTFINNSGLGVYPAIVRHREWHQQQGKSKRFALLLAVMRAMFYCPFLHLDFVIAGVKLVRRTPLVFVGNNDYAPSNGELGVRERLDKSILSLFITHDMNHLRFLGLMISAWLTGIEGLTTLDKMTVDQFTVLSKKSKLRVSLDGEVCTLATPLHYRILPKSLKVITL